MSKYIDAEKLKAEIFNLEPFSCLSEVQDGFYSAINRINDIIDSLQQEQPEVDLEEEVKRWKDKHGIVGMDVLWIDFARHIYELGRLSNK